MPDPGFDNPEKSSRPPPEVLNYQRGQDDLVRLPRPRKQIPRPTAIGFAATSVALATAWIMLDSTGQFVPHVALFAAGAVALVGFSLAIWPATRLAGAGVLVALGTWLLLLGACSRIGFVRPGVI